MLSQKSALRPLSVSGHKSDRDLLSSQLKPFGDPLESILPPRPELATNLKQLLAD